MRRKEDFAPGAGLFLYIPKRSPAYFYHLSFLDKIYFSFGVVRRGRGTGDPN